MHMQFDWLTMQSQSKNVYKLAQCINNSILGPRMLETETAQ